MAAMRRKMFCFLAISCAVGLFPTARTVDPGRIDCHEKITGFLDCVNKTLSEKHSPGSKFRLAKMRVNECLQTNRCARMYITDTRLGDPEAENGGSSPIRQTYHVVHQCMHDVKEQAMPLVQKCVDELVPGAPMVKKHSENRWKIIQQSMNKTQLQNLCAYNGNATGAFNCIDRLFSPNTRVRQQQEKRFKEFCTAARQCRVGMGLCRTELDNGRKAICDCMSRIYDDFNNIKKDVPSCANVTSEMIKSSRGFHPPFMDDNCGPDPCDHSFRRLTNGTGKDHDESAAEGDTETGH